RWQPDCIAHLTREPGVSHLRPLPAIDLHENFDAVIHPTLIRGDESFTLDHPPSMYFNSGSATVAAALAGLGVAFLPTAKVAAHFESGTLVEVLPQWHMASMPISIVYPYTRRLSARVRAFTDWVTTLMANDPLWAPSWQLKYQ